MRNDEIEDADDGGGDDDKNTVDGEEVDLASGTKLEIVH